MEHQKILDLLNEPNNSKFVTKKWNIANEQSNANYDVWNEIIYNIEVLKSDLCDYNDAYILVRGNITIIRNRVKQVAFKNFPPFTKCITKIDGTITDDAEDLNLLMPMHSLIEYSSNYSKTTGSLWFYSKDEATNFNVEIDNTNNFKSFKCNAKLLGNSEAQPTPYNANEIPKSATTAVPLKSLSNF